MLYCSQGIFSRRFRSNLHHTVGIVSDQHVRARLQAFEHVGLVVDRPDVHLHTQGVRLVGFIVEQQLGKMRMDGVDAQQVDEPPGIDELAVVDLADGRAKQADPARSGRCA